MNDTPHGYSCQNCMKSLQPNEKPCSNCNSELRLINIHLSETVRVRSSFSLKKFGAGSKDFLTHLKQGWFDSADTTKHPEGVQLIQNVDREKNQYTKKVTDEKTGVVVKDLEEPLDEHYGRTDKLPK